MDALARAREYTRLLARQPNFSYQLSDLSYRFCSEAGRIIEPAEARELWLDALRARGAVETTTVYVSVPFCPARCHFCLYFEQIPDDPEVLERYNRQLCAQGDFFAEVLALLKAENVYLGGGSPSLFNEGQLGALCEHVFARAGFLPKGEHTAELHPPGTTAPKLKMLRSVGFNRASFGVQSLSPEILKSIGRAYQTPAVTRRAIEAAWAAGFKEVNADLLCGVGEGRGDLLLDSFTGLTAMGPSMITMYFNEPTPSYLREHYKGNRERFEADLKRELAGYAKAKTWARENGWEVDEKAFPSNTLFHKKGRKPFAGGGYDFELKRRGQAVFSLGEKAISYVSGRMRYATGSLADDPAKVLYRGSRFDARDEMRHYLLEGWGHERGVPVRDFKRIFGVDPRKALATELGGMKKLGLLGKDKDAVRLAGEDRAERWARGMLLFDKKLVAERVSAHCARVPLEVSINGRRRALRLAYTAGPGPKIVLDDSGFTASTELELRVLELCRRVFAGLDLEDADLGEALELLQAEIAKALGALSSRAQGRVPLKLGCALAEA